MLRKLMLAGTAIAALVLVGGSAVQAQYGPSPTLTVDDTTVVVGQTVTLTGEGWPAGDTVTFTLAGQVIGTTTAAGDTTRALGDPGTFSAQAVIPQVDPGTYSITGNSGDGTAEAAVVVEVLAAAVTPPLPRTGTDLNVAAMVGVGTVALGGVAVALATSRRRSAA